MRDGQRMMAEFCVLDDWRSGDELYIVSTDESAHRMS
jgi:hypothetical protein